MPPNRRLLWLLVPLSLAALLLLPAGRNAVLAQLRGKRAPAAPRANASGAPSTTGLTALPVEGEVAVRGPFVLHVSGSGRIESLHRAELAARVAERIVAVHAREGDAVGAGDALVELDRRPFEVALREAEAQHARAEAEWKASLLGQPEANAEITALLRHKSGLTAAEDAVERARLDLEGAVVRAPFAGVVATMTAAVGERAAVNQPLVTLVDPTALRVRVELLEHDLTQVRVGAAARIRIPALGDRVVRGIVRALGPEIDPARGTGRVYVEIEDPDRSIRPGMYAEVEVAGEVLPDRIVVPRGAVLERDRKLVVFRARRGRAEWTYVEVGRGTEEEVEITAGLSPGDTVLTEGHLTLAHGAPVAVTAAERRDAR